MTTAIDIPMDWSRPPKEIPLKSFHSRYQAISSLGNGSFGTVQLVKAKGDREEFTCETAGTMMEPLVDSQSNLNQLVAVKTMKKRLPLLNDYSRLKEVRFILNIPSHPCLIQVYDMFIDDITYQLHITMESMSQNLYQLMKGRRNIHFSPVTLRSVLSQILNAIRHIHKYEYFHRDVKPENILIAPTLSYYGSKEAVPPHRRLDNFVVKLADYGLARSVHNVRTFTAYVSTRWYRSPEILLRQRSYGRPIDVWAFGAVAAEVAKFCPLFPGANELDQIWRILKVLGCPLVPAHPSDSHNDPLGGYWSEAQALAYRLGFIIPDEEGLDIEEVLPDPSHCELSKVVSACLTWDPRRRATADEVWDMPYFKNCKNIRDYSRPERMSSKPVKSSTFEALSTVQPYETNANFFNPLKPVGSGQKRPVGQLVITTNFTGDKGDQDEPQQKQQRYKEYPIVPQAIKANNKENAIGRTSSAPLMKASSRNTKYNIDQIPFELKDGDEMDSFDDSRIIEDDFESGVEDSEIFNDSDILDLDGSGFLEDDEFINDLDAGVNDNEQVEDALEDESESFEMDLEQFLAKTKHSNDKITKIMAAKFGDRRSESEYRWNFTREESATGGPAMGKSTREKKGLGANMPEKSQRARRYSGGDLGMLAEISFGSAQGINAS